MEDLRSLAQGRLLNPLRASPYRARIPRQRPPNGRKDTSTNAAPSQRQAAKCLTQPPIRQHCCPNRSPRTPSIPAPRPAVAVRPGASLPPNHAQNAPHTPNSTAAASRLTSRSAHGAGPTATGAPDRCSRGICSCAWTPTPHGTPSSTRQASIRCCCQAKNQASSLRPISARYRPGTPSAPPRCQPARSGRLACLAASPQGRCSPDTMAVVTEVGTDTAHVAVMMFGHLRDRLSDPRLSHHTRRYD